MDCAFSAHCHHHARGCTFLCWFVAVACSCSRVFALNRTDTPFSEFCAFPHHKSQIESCRSYSPKKALKCNGAQKNHSSKLFFTTKNTDLFYAGVSKTHAKTHFSQRNGKKEHRLFEKTYYPVPPHLRQFQLCRWERRFRGPKPQKAWDPLRCRDLVARIRRPRS